MKRRRSEKGESLIETLLAMLVIALGLAILMGAIAKSSKLNEESASDNVMSFMSVDSGDAFPGCNVTLTLSGAEKTSNVSVTCYRVRRGTGETPLEYYQ